MSEKHTETLTITAQADGYTAISVRRLYPSGLEYRSTLFILPGDTEAFAVALETFRAGGHKFELALSDNAKLRLFANDYYTELNMEIFRPEGMPYGGYDTFSVTYKLLPDLISKVKSINSYKEQT